MYSIGQLAKQTGVKVPTIRYYEQMGLIDALERTEGNQRRYSKDELKRLSFIRHSRDLGFAIEADAPDGALNAAPDAVFRIETRDHSRVPLRNVEVRGDSLYGENPSCRRTLALGSAPGRSWCSGIAIARADVVRTEVRVAAPYRTNVAILLFGLVWCAVMVACLELFSEARGAAMSPRLPARASDESVRS